MEGNTNGREHKGEDEGGGLRERIIGMMKHYELKPTGFARSAGISQGLVNNFLKGAADSLSFKVLQKILYAYPDISAEWLMLGSGEMLKGDAMWVESGEAKLHLEYYKNLTETLKEENTELLKKIIALSDKLLNSQKNN